MSRTIFITLLMLVVLPLIAMISETYFIEIKAPYPSYLTYYETSVVIILLIYALSPIIIRGKSYFNRQSFEEFVVEYDFLKKLIYCGMPLLILAMLLFLLTSDPMEVNFSYAILPGMILIVGGVFLRFISNVSKKEYRYYYARGCFQLLRKESDASEKMTYFIKAINSYNKYLRRTLKLQISSTDNIYSMIISDPSFDRAQFVSAVSVGFQSEDKLEPTKYLKSVMNKHSEDFLTKEPFWSKIKDFGAFIAAMVPIVISIIQFVLSPVGK